MEKIGTEELAQLIQRAAKGDDEAFARICRIYEGLVKKSVISFSSRIDMPSEDIEQEALLALSRASKRYDPELTGVTFGLYAKICIKNALISLERKSLTRRRKSEKASRLSEASRDVTGDSVSWLSAAVRRERIQRLLTPFENQVLQMFIDGLSYEEIAEDLGISKKKVDNTLYRLRKKLKSSELG